MHVRDLLAHDGLFWRKLAHLGASRAPEWWVRYSPPLFGWAAAAMVPEARRAVRANLRRIRGPASPWREAVDVLDTFSSYACCLAEVLSNGSKNARDPAAAVHGAQHVYRVLRERRGFIIATAHTAGWEIVGPLLFREESLQILMVMEPERNESARRIHDEARTGTGALLIAHVGHDPLASLPLLNHLRGGGVVALQVDRAPPGMKTRAVSLFGRPAALPEGPIRLAQLTGAPILPIFSARDGYRRYVVEISPPITVPRRATEAEKDAAVGAIADAMERFLRSHPTQWFHFRGAPP